MTTAFFYYYDIENVIQELKQTSIDNSRLPEQFRFFEFKNIMQSFFHKKCRFLLLSETSVKVFVELLPNENPKYSIHEGLRCFH